MIAPVVQNPELATVLSDIYAQLTRLEGLVGQAAVGRQAQTAGDSGALRVTKVSNDKYAVEVKSKDGWVTAEFTLATAKGG